jgi:hypothetical protein
MKNSDLVKETEMRKHKLFATLAPAAVLAAAVLFFSPTASAQVTVERRPGQRPAPVRPTVVTADTKASGPMSEEAFREMLMKRLNALEAENKELRSQLKDFKAQFAAHKHSIRYINFKGFDPDALALRLEPGAPHDWKETSPPVNK